MTSWATRRWAVEQHLSYVPSGWDDPAPATAVCDAWEPPDPLSLPADLCGRLRAAGAASRRYYGPNGSYYLPDLDDEDRAAVVSRFEAANRQWWRLVIDRWDVLVKRYDVGERHPPHTDWHLVAGAGRKLAGSVQLSSADEYDGGMLVVSFAHHRIPMPQAVGTVVAFPGWTVHEVEQVTRGQRWALIVNGFGPPLR